MYTMIKVLSISLMLWIVIASAQTEQAFNIKKKSSGLFDPSKIKIYQNASFNLNSIKSQGLYSTMLQYKFSQPITVSLSFGLPLFSSFDSRSNLTPENLKSKQYFQSMPFDATLSWQPSDKMLMQISVARYTGASNNFTNPSLLGYGRFGMFDGW
jgi:hypothetical protein